MGSPRQRRAPDARRCVWRYDSSRTPTATIPCWRPGVRPSTVWNRPKSERVEHLAIFWFSWHYVLMESTPCELTPEQKGLRESLARETGIAVVVCLSCTLRP